MGVVNGCVFHPVDEGENTDVLAKREPGDPEASL
jgi:hypothetical protein